MKEREAKRRGRIELIDLRGEIIVENRGKIWKKVDAFGKRW